MKKKKPCLGIYKHDWLMCTAHHDGHKPPFPLPYWFCFRCGKATDKEPKAMRLRRLAFKADPNCKHTSYRQIENKHGQVSHECASASCRVPVRLTIVPPRPPAPPPVALDQCIVDRATLLLKKGKLSKVRRIRLFRRWCKARGKKKTVGAKKKFMRLIGL